MQSQLGNGHTPAARHYVQTPGTGGYYESWSDAHLYDLMSDAFASNLDETCKQDRSDVLVVTAAWRVKSEELIAVRNWLDRRPMMPGAWLTGDNLCGAIDADVWLETQDDSRQGSFIVLRMDGPYIESVPLRLSLDAALGRFDSLRRAVESEWSDGVAFIPVGATSQWLDSMADETNEQLFCETPGDDIEPTY